jgi:hypothetical protein
MSGSQAFTALLAPLTMTVMLGMAASYRVEGSPGA